LGSDKCAVIGKDAEKTDYRAFSSIMWCQKGDCSNHKDLRP
jgi:hypothetical protein